MLSHILDNADPAVLSPQSTCVEFLPNYMFEALPSEGKIFDSHSQHLSDTATRTNHFSALKSVEMAAEPVVKEHRSKFNVFVSHLWAPLLFLGDLQVSPDHPPRYTR